jgi:hypothetical protein
MAELTRRPRPGDIVQTPNGPGYLLHPAARTKGAEWIVMIGTKGHIVSVDEMGMPSTLEPAVTIPREFATSPKEMGQTGTQLEMGI